MYFVLDGHEIDICHFRTNFLNKMNLAYGWITETHLFIQSGVHIAVFLLVCDAHKLYFVVSDLEK